MIIFFVFLKPNNNRNRNFRRDFVVEYLEEKVGFSQVQIDSFKVLRDENNKRMMPYFSKMRSTREDLYKMVYDSMPPSDSVLNAKVDSIGMAQAQVEKALFEHFKEIRAICTPGQQPAFDSLLNRLFRRGAAGNPPPRSGWKDKPGKEKQKG